MEQELKDFIVDDGFDYDEDTTYDPSDEDDSDLSSSEFGEDQGYVTFKIPIPLLFDEEWFKRFQILNSIEVAGEEPEKESE